MSEDIQIVVSAPLKVAAALWQERWWCCAAFVVATAANSLPAAGYLAMAIRFAYEHLLHDASGIGRIMAGVLGVLVASLAWQSPVSETAPAQDTSPVRATGSSTAS